MKMKKIILAVISFVIIFAGSTCFTGTGNEVLAVDTTLAEKVMNVKCQVTADTDKNTKTPVNMRLVSSVDCLENYKEVGFEVYYNGADTAVPIRTSTVYERIEACADSGVEYNYSPKVISTNSKYFVTATLINIHPDNFNNTFYIKPYCITTEGQTLYGVSRYVKVSDYYNNMINVPVKATEAQTTGMTVDFNTTKLKQVEGYAHDGAYAHLKFQVNDGQTLSSLTSFVVKDSEGTTIDTVTHRNLTTEYTGDGVGDTSWYTEALVADSTETEFIIATNADLYGLAKLVNTDHVSFNKQHVYLVADIEANDDSSTLTYNWTPIGHRNGGTYYSFTGTFDGQMHTVSGVHCDMSKVTAFSDTRYGGFFGPITSANTTIKNFKLVDSYFTSNNSDFGSITGYGAGTFSNIYSNAIVNGCRERLGGLIGAIFVTNTKINECWFDGTVTNTNVSNNAKIGTGGLVGKTFTGVTTITNCLNTGRVDASSFTAKSSTSPTDVVPMVAGLIGEVGKGTTANISNCLNAGNIRINASATTGYGYIVGYNAGTVTMSKNNVYSTTGDWTTDVINKSSQTANITQKNQDEYEGQSLANLDFDTIWTTIPNHIPVLRSLKTTVIDDSWYDEDKDTFALYDKADLYGFAALSQTENFAGKTVKLGNDITVNTGDSSTWGTNAPRIEWTPIGKKELPFAGTFDGGMHTISGLYMNTTKANSGLFSVTGGTSILKNFKLSNSYFTSTTNGIGSIVGQGRGLIDTVKSDATVVGATAQTGGLMGMAYGTDVQLKYSWFGGTVKNNGTTAGHRGTGGLIGVIYTGGNVQMTDCLNSGMVDATTSTQYVPKAGGLVGNVESDATLTTTNCVNVGTISVASGKLGGVIAGCIDGGAITSNTTYGYGSNCTVGYMQNSGTFNVNYILNGKAGKEDETVDRTYLGDVPVINSNRTFTGQDVVTSLEGLDFENTWIAVDNSTPVLNFGDTIEMVDTRWYNADSKEFVLYDMGDLYGFAELVKSGERFLRKTVKLGRDIAVNEGTAKYWGSKAPKYAWTGTGTTVFAGTFDGQGHTISGIYMSATANRQGFFGFTEYTSVIKNFNLKNSYFVSNTWGLGSIAGQGRGQFLNIYSDAIVTCPQHFVGGIVGLGMGTELIMKNCWFDGSVTNTGNATGYRGTGGILGGIYENGGATISNCLNEGIVNAKAYTYDQNTGKMDEEGNPLTPNVTVMVGGIVGYIQKNATADISGCLNVGEIQYADVATGGYGPIVGYNTAGTTLTISGCYATKESCEAIDLSNISSDSVTQVDAADIKGDAAKDEMKILDWDTAWACRTNDFPMVVFTEKTTEDKDYTATGADDALLSALYGNYTLYQGELHNHANNGGSSDGNVSLAEWKTQMTTYDLDFAASLDHRQTWHINHDDWDKSLFIYGTEAGTTISDYDGETGKGELHYNMIFAEQSQLKNVVENFKNGVFNYSSFLDSSSFGNKLASGFSYPKFTHSEFSELIDTVKADNNNDGKPDGLFILAHPMQIGSAYFSDNALDYMFVRDYIGFEVIYTQLNCGNTRTNYKAWKELLVAGKRLWATSGSDSHENLDSKTLTSVYANEADKADGKLINYMVNGNFTAGSAGIQMCVGDTPMGGHRDFTDQRVVVNVGELHTSVYNATNKYRIDILNEDGIVYSQALTVDETTKTPTNGTIAFDADANSDFYRVVIYDMTKGYRIAYGNPIWNDK